MKPIAIFIVVAAVSVAIVAASAKTVSAPGSTHDRMVAGVAGPVAAANTSQKKMKAKKSAAPSDDQLRTNATKGHPHSAD